MPKISIIVPTYNAEKYIQKGLDTLINQSLKDIEILCIDDCSTDNTQNMINDYAKNDNRVKVIIMSENGGVSKVRNKGIELAQGEYIGFMDSDDWVDLDFYEKLYNKAKSTNADIVKGEMLKLYPDRTLRSRLYKRIKKNKFRFHGEFYTAIYKREFINKNNIKFPVEVKTSEDIPFALNSVIYCSKIEFVTDSFYYYFQRPDSKVKTFNKNVINSLELCAKHILNLINNANLSKKDYKFVLYDTIIKSVIVFRGKRMKLSFSEIEDYSVGILNVIKHEIKYKFRDIENLDFEKTYINLYPLKYTFMQNLFSIRNYLSYKIITILGVKLYVKRKKNKNAES